jgi:uncharacterized membrane protein
MPGVARKAVSVSHAPDVTIASRSLMNLCRYQVSENVHIDAPVEHAYEIASDPELVPSYAHEIDRIEIVERFTEHRVLVKSYLKLPG